MWVELFRDDIKLFAIYAKCEGDRSTSRRKERLEVYNASWRNTSMRERDGWVEEDNNWNMYSQLNPIPEDAHRKRIVQTEGEWLHGLYTTFESQVRQLSLLIFCRAKAFLIINLNSTQAPYIQPKESFAYNSPKDRNNPCLGKGTLTKWCLTASQNWLTGKLPK